MEQVQLRALQMFFEVGTLHPNSQGFIATTSGGSACCVGGKDALCEVLVEGLNNEMYEGRLLRKIARQAVECGKGVWVKNMAKCVGVFEWQGIGGDTIKSLTDAEIGDMLSSVAWRKVRSMLIKELEERPKLGMMKEIVALELESSCAVLKRKRDRRMMIKLRGGTAAFQIEVRRWQEVERKERMCKECQRGEVEDVCHWLLQCPAWDHLR